MLKLPVVVLFISFLACTHQNQDVIEPSSQEVSPDPSVFVGGEMGQTLGVNDPSGGSAQPTYEEQEGTYVEAEEAEVPVWEAGTQVGDEVDEGNVSKTEESANDAESQVDSYVHLISPSGFSSPSPVTFMANAGVGVVRVRYLALAIYSDQLWTLGESTDVGAQFPVSYAFSEAGLRQILIQGLDANGVVIAELQAGVTIEAQQAVGAGGELPGCPTGQIPDCNGKCCNESWVGDGYCDDGSAYEIVLTCPLLGNDGGDCDQATACPAGYMADCNGLCVKIAWHGDGYCDDGTNYDADFMCAAFDYDEGDCEQNSNNGSGGNSNAAVGGALNVPYFYQYFNSLFPSASCQNTAIAMVLGFYGWSGTPDVITGQWGKNVAQSPGGLAMVFNSIAESSGMAERILPHTNGNIAGLKALLAEGKPVIVHGYLSSYGHVLVATDYSNGVYTVNDSAGKWNQQFKGGYPYGTNGTIGKGITYSAAAFELAISSTNGSNYVPLWYHEIVY